MAVAAQRAGAKVCACRAVWLKAAVESQVAFRRAVGPARQPAGGDIRGRGWLWAGALQAGALSGVVARGGQPPGVAADVLWQEGVAGAHAGGSGVLSVCE